MNATKQRSPLGQLRVLDLTHMIAGPYCTRLFALYGAEVIKIERPGDGDPLRKQYGEFAGRDDAKLSYQFLYLNTGKKSVQLNLKTAGGRDVFLQLLRKCDLVVENFRPGVMADLGLDFNTLASASPRLVMLSISNFGQTGPYRDYKATDLTLQAWAGVMHMVGDASREPLRLGYSAPEFIAGQNAFAAALAALLVPRQTRGRRVDIAIMDTAMTGLNSAQAHYSYSQVVPGRRDRGRPPSGVRYAKDGMVMAELPRGVAALQRLSKILGFDLPADDPKAASARFAQWAIERTKEEVMSAGQQAHLAWGALNDIREIMNSPHLLQRGFFQSVEHPIAGALNYAGAPFRMSAMPAHLEPAPTLGQHTREMISRHLSYSDQQLRALELEGVI